MSFTALFSIHCSKNIPSISNIPNPVYAIWRPRGFLRIQLFFLNFLQLQTDISPPNFGPMKLALVSIDAELNVENWLHFDYEAL